MKEWYLEHTPPTITSDYDSESIVNYGEENFTDVLEVAFSDTVILYNSDLSESKVIKCVIQGNTSDTQLKSIERIGLFKIGTVKAGMYVFFENRFWLIDGYPGNNKSYEKATMVLCQYNLRWQNNNGDIIERWGNFSSASKYDVGEGGNNVIFLTSNNYSIKLPFDKETLELDGKRVFIDKHVHNPTKVFKITRDDDILSDYGDEHGCVLNFIADKTELNLEVDNPELRICDYFFPTPLPSVKKIITTIVGNENLRYGRKKTYEARFTDLDGNELSFDNFKWNVENAYIKSNIIQNKIELYIDDDSLVGESFLLQILNDKNEILSEKNINIVEGW